MKSLRWTASAITLAIAAAPALAADEHPCIDEACTMVSIIGQGGAAQGSGSGAIEAVRMGTWGIDTAGMDKSVKPGDDFFGFVNGNWARTTQIPADRSSYGGFAVLAELSEARSAASSKATPPETRRATAIRPRLRRCTAPSWTKRPSSAPTPSRS
jgi:putative endopeptidase